MTAAGGRRPAAIVTGGSRGIGRATALAAAHRGYDVLLSYNTRRDAAEAVIAEVATLGGRGIAVQAEMSDPASIDAMFERFDNEFERLDAVINNAGTTGPMSTLDELDMQVLKRVLAINVMGAFAAAQHAARRMATSRGGNGGAIVNVSSRAGQLGGPHEWLHYGASKGAIDTFTVGLARELGPEGIRVNAVSPGLIDTEIHASSGGTDRLARLAHTVPQARIGTADEVADTIVWLMADAPGYVTGSNIHISGGR